MYTRSPGRRRARQPIGAPARRRPSRRHRRGAALSERIVQFIADYGYLALFFGIFLDNFGLPSGSEALVFVAVGLADEGSLDLRLVVVLAAVAAIASDQVLYFLAAKGVRRITERFVPQKAMAHAEGFYERHGPQALFLARFLPAIRTEMTFVAGYTRMPYRRFLFWDLLGIGVWLTVLTVLGVLFSESVTALLSSYTRLVTVGLWIVLTAAVVFILYKFVKWRRSRQQM